MGLVGHPLTKRAEKPEEIVAEEARKKPDAHPNNYFRLIFELSQVQLRGMRRKDHHQIGNACQEAGKGHLNAAYYFRFHFEMRGLSEC